MIVLDSRYFLLGHYDCASRHLCFKSHIGLKTDLDLCPFSDLLPGADVREQLRDGRDAGQRRHVPHHGGQDPLGGGRHQHALPDVLLRNVHLLRAVCVQGKLKK